MSSQSEVSVKRGANTLWTLQLIFLVLQITSLVHWSWWAVFIPMYIFVGLTILLIIIALIGLAATKIAAPNGSSIPHGLRGRK